jgi:hypothetical protein
MAVSIKQATFVVDDVSDIVVTTIEQEEEGGQYVREIRIFGTPSEAGQQAPQEFVLRLKADEQEPLNITVPSLIF